MAVQDLLAELAAHAADHAEAAPAVVPGLVVRRSNAPTTPVPALFEPVFYVVLQGAKRLTFAGRTDDFDAGTCAVAAVGLPFVSQVIGASAVRPYVGVEWKLDPALVFDLSRVAVGTPEAAAPGFATAPADAAALEPFGRLLRLVATPADATALIPSYAREVCYRLLQGPLGPTLRHSARPGSRIAQVRAAADWIAANADRPLGVARLAAKVGMSVTSLHRHFKAVTGHSPLAYQRYLRLLDARRRLLGGQPVTSTAFVVGYSSASQFSREYKRLFGAAPVSDARIDRPARPRICS